MQTWLGMHLDLGREEFCPDSEIGCPANFESGGWLPDWSESFPSPKPDKR